MGRLDHDNKIVSKYLGGDGDAFRLIESYVDKAFIPFQRRLRPFFDDIQQEVHLTLLREFSKEAFEIHTSLRAYVGEVTARRCLQQLTSRDLRDDKELNKLMDAWSAEIIEEFQLDPKAMHERSVLNRKLMLVYQMASETCKIVFRMLLEGFPYEDIAKELGVTVAAIKWRIFACRGQARSDFSRIRF